MVSYKKWQASKKGIFKYCFQSKVASCKSKSRELLAMGNMSSRKLLIHIKIYQQLIEMCVFFFLLFFFSFVNVSAGVWCSEVGQDFSCQQFTPKKPLACVCHQFPACVCGSGNTEQEDGRRDVWAERGNCCGFFVGLRMTEFWVCFSCCIAEQPQPVSMKFARRTDLFNLSCLVFKSF